MKRKVSLVIVTLLLMMSVMAFTGSLVAAAPSETEMAAVTNIVPGSAVEVAPTAFSLEVSALHAPPSTSAVTGSINESFVIAIPDNILSNGTAAAILLVTAIALTLVTLRRQHDLQHLMRCAPATTSTRARYGTGRVTKFPHQAMELDSFNG